MKTKAKSSKSKGLCKMSASLAALIVSAKKKPVFGESLALGATSPATVAADPTVHVFVRCQDASSYEVVGVPLSKGAGYIMTAMVPLSKVNAFVGSKKVMRASAPRQMRPLMDVAAPLVKVPQFRKKTKSSGRGVIVGIVDSGIDSTHPAFTGRILSLWDQVIPGQGPGAGFSKFGTVLSGAAMGASQDTSGHGTHVAGIAAGQGSPFEGMAPAADLIIVKTNFQNTAIAEGVRWIFSEATRLGRPCVVNLSLGGHFDGHDGADDLSVAISDECGPGRLVVAAAGNEGTDAIHALQRVSAGHPASLIIRVNPKSSPVPAPFFLLNGWYSGGGVCEVRILSSTGAVTPWQALIKTDPGAKTHMLGSDKVVIATPDELAPNGDRQFLIEVEGSGGGVQGGMWKLEVRRKLGNPGDLHVWLLTDPDRAQSARFDSPVFSHLIGAPGTGSEVITVASFTSRNEWVDLSGNRQSVGLVPGTISDFSSPGPLRDGQLKPDVAAPGAMIGSCLSSNANVKQQDVVAARHRMNAGTSMASPFVAGLVALLLEKQPTMTPTQAKARLKQSARVPGFAAGTHHPKWGFGLLKL